MSQPTPPAQPFRWRYRGYLLAGAGAAFLAAAVAARDPVLILIAVPLLVAPVAAALVSPRPATTADLAWQATGDSGAVRITGVLRTTPASATDDLIVSFVRPATLSEAEPSNVEWWPGAVRFELAWRSPHITVETVPPPSVEWQDPMGLVERPVGGRRSELVVDPSELDALRLGAVRLERVRHLIGRVSNRHLGSTGEFFEIRAAAPDDPPRRINWWASARIGKMLANELEFDRRVDLVVLVDARPTVLGEVMDEKFLGVARAAAAGISGMFLREKTRVGYAAFGEFLEAVPLSTGRTHAVRIRHAIRTTRRSATGGPSERCAVSLRRLFPLSVTVVLLSSLGGDDVCDVVVHLRRRGFPVVVLNPSWRSLIPRGTTLPAREDAMATRLGQLERRTRLAATRTYAPVVDWEDLSSLGEFTRWLQHPTRGRG